MEKPDTFNRKINLKMFSESNLWKTPRFIQIFINLRIDTVG
jgi:hypothetical protein